MGIEEKWQEVDQIRQSYMTLTIAILSKIGEITLSPEDTKSAYLNRDKVIMQKCPDGSTKLKVINKCKKCNGFGSIACPECEGSGYPIKEEGE